MLALVMCFVAQIDMGVMAAMQWTLRSVFVKDLLSVKLKPLKKSPGGFKGNKEKKGAPG